jgi:hypothetical protein
MVKNFESETQELSQEELMLVNPLMLGLESKTKAKPIKGKDIIQKMNVFAKEKKLPKLNDVRLRKLINHIRSNSLLPVMASSKGYYVSYDKEDIMAQVDSLNQRAKSIMNCAKGLQNFVK